MRTFNAASLCSCLSLALVCALPARAPADPIPTIAPSELVALVAEGGLVTVDRRFTDADVMAVAAQAQGRLTVIASGFSTPVAHALLARRAVLFIDKTFSGPDIVALATAGRAHVVVDPAGVAAEVVAQAQAAGALVKPDEGGATLAQKLQTLRAGGQVVVDRGLSATDVKTLIAAGPGRVHVIARGFTAADAHGFVSGHAIVWLDRTFATVEVLAMARAGGQFVVVRADRFAFEDLRSFAHAKAQIVFAPFPGRSQERAGAFDTLYGTGSQPASGDPESRSWRSGIWVRPLALR